MSYSNTSLTQYLNWFALLFCICIYNVYCNMQQCYTLPIQDKISKNKCTTIEYNIRVILRSQYMASLAGLSFSSGSNCQYKQISNQTPLRC